MTAELAHLDLDDTSSCPIADTCLGCGRTDDLAVGTAEAVGIGAGVFCVTICGECAAKPLPAMAPLDALSRVCVHCEHLDVDLDAMARALREAR